MEPPRLQSLDWHQLELRYAPLRLADPSAIARLARSIAVNGQLVPCIGVIRAEGAIVLVDGYRRVAALKQLGRDTVEVECWCGDLTHVLLGVLARARSRALAPIEEAYLLRELMAEASLSQHEIARRCDRDVSWVNRRLQLLTGLPDSVLEAVRRGDVSTWAAVRILAPLARANTAHSEQILAGLRKTPLSTRQLTAWFEQYQRASKDVRARMVEAPGLLLNALTAQQEQKRSVSLRDGPEGEVLADIRLLDSVSARLSRKLCALSTSSPTALPPAVTAATSSLYHALESLQHHLMRICHHDTPSALPSGTDTASTRPGRTRDQPEPEAVA